MDIISILACKSSLLIHLSYLMTSNILHDHMLLFSFSRFSYEQDLNLICVTYSELETVHLRLFGQFSLWLSCVL